MDDPEGRFIYPAVLFLGFVFAVLFPVLRSSRSVLPGVKISIVLLGIFIMAWAVCGILMETSAFAVRIPQGGMVVVNNIRRFLGGVATGIFICLAVTGNLNPRKG